MGFFSFFSGSEEELIARFFISDFGFTKKNSKTIINLFGEICEDFISIGDHFDEKTIVEIEQTNAKAIDFENKGGFGRAMSGKPTYPWDVKRCIVANGDLKGKIETLSDMIDGLFDEGVDEFVTRTLQTLHKRKILGGDKADLLITGRRNNDIISRKARLSYKDEILTGKYT